MKTFYNLGAWCATAPGSIIIYLLVKYKEFSVIFYNLQCDDISNQWFIHSLRTFLKTAFHIITFHFDNLSSQKEYLPDHLNVMQRWPLHQESDVNITNERTERYHFFYFLKCS